MPFFPPITGSSPRWLKMDEILKPASDPQKQSSPFTRSAPQLRGQIRQSFKESLKFNKSNNYLV